LVEGQGNSGIIRFGYFREDTLVWKNARSLLKRQGKLVLKGQTRFGSGVYIQVEKDAILEIGNDVLISNNCKIICYKKITIGNHCRIAWETQIIDTMFHFIKEIETGRISSLSQPITLGDNNWIGNRVSVMKGSQTPNYCIIASGSMVNKKLNVPENCIVAGTPVKLIKIGVYRVLMEEELLLKKKLREKDEDSFFNS